MNMISASIHRHVESHFSHVRFWFHFVNLGLTIFSLLPPSSIIQHWQLLLSSPLKLWPGSRLPPAPWAWRRVQPRPSFAYDSLCGRCRRFSVSSEGYKDSGNALQCPPARFTLYKKHGFSLSKSISVTLCAVTGYAVGGQINLNVFC